MTKRNKETKELSILMVNQVVQATMQGTKFGTVTIWGAMVFRDQKHLLGNRDRNHIENANKRRKQAEETMRLLPFPVVTWSSFYAPDCPGIFNPRSHRGISMTHYQIWAHWEYQGRLGTNRINASDSDMLVVFEDDAVITVKNIVQSLEHELSPVTMKSDLNLLGWCYDEKDMMSGCTYAYAVTRKGVKKILAAWNTCSPEPIHQELKNMSMRGIFSWQKACLKSCLDQLGEFSNITGLTRGLFVQMKAIVILQNSSGLLQEMKEEKSYLQQISAFPKSLEKRVISFSLYGTNEKYIHGALHNVELALVYFPGWVCRFYVNSDVPIDALNALKRLGAEVENVPTGMGHSSGMFFDSCQL